LFVFFVLGFALKISQQVPNFTPEKKKKKEKRKNKKKAAPKSNTTRRHLLKLWGFIRILLGWG
jgi:hypothetical protein